MSAESELYAALIAFPGLSSVIADRIYPDAIPENAALPSVVYSLDDCSPIYGLGNENHATNTQIKINVWSLTRTEAKLVGDQIALALIAIGVPIDKRYSGFDAEVGEFADISEITWWE